MRDKSAGAQAWAGKHYWIVGASEGLGRAIAVHLSSGGATLTLSGRRQTALEAVAAELPGPAFVAPCDVRDAGSVRAAIHAAPPLDGLVYCAALYEPMPASAWDEDAVEAMCDVNFTGAARVLGAALPGMIARRRGHVVMIGSLVGRRGLPASIGYGASKAGMIHLAESVRVDLPRDGFTIQVMNPGFIRTRLTDKNDFAMPFLMEPDAAARRVVRAMRTRRFRTEFPRRLALGIGLLGLLPDALYFRLIGRASMPKAPETAP